MNLPTIGPVLDTISKFFFCLENKGNEKPTTKTKKFEPKEKAKFVRAIFNFYVSTISSR